MSFLPLQRPAALDDLDDDMMAELVEKYHFGGGGAFEKAAVADGGPKSRKEVMEEVIAKSKMYKAMKAKQKEEDEQEMEELDQEFTQLVQSRHMAGLLKPPGFDR